jgi:hypothetical protein
MGNFFTKSDFIIFQEGLCFMQLEWYVINVYSSLFHKAYIFLYDDFKARRTICGIIQQLLLFRNKIKTGWVPLVDKSYFSQSDLICSSPHVG